MSSGWLDLDPRALQGDFLTAAFQHPTLGPHGTPEDTTVVYLVTRGHGLAQSLLPAIQRFDPAVHVSHPTNETQGDGHAQYRTSQVADDPGGPTGTFCGYPPVIRRSEERRVGQECARKCRSRWLPTL